MEWELDFKDARSVQTTKNLSLSRAVASAAG